MGALGCAYVVYSTRSHERAAPRLRLVFPTDRDMQADEYEPVARKLAARIGMEFCDPTTFEAERLMYRPSVCSGAEYVYEFRDGPFLSVEGMLATYSDWRDMAEWPEAPGEPARISGNLRRQQDPEAKPGIVGMFCRVYDVPKAMGQFLPGVYEPCGPDGRRYTFTGGSTTGGAVLYDSGKFLYSHHATDPAGGRLCNAFDLVRLHRYGDLDDGAKPDTPAGNLPSYKAMAGLARQDGAVRLETARSVFPDAGPEDTDFLSKLEFGKDNRLKKNTKNIRLVLENTPALAGKFCYDTFSGRVYTQGGLPWNPETPKRELTDADMAGLRVYLEDTYELTGGQKIQDVFDTFMQETARHAVREYLEGLQWDGTKRLDTVLTDYLGAEDSEYTRKVSRKLFCAAVARVMVPGVKYDYLTVLIGRQGAGKSTFCRVMGVDWFSDSLKVVDMRSKTGAEKLMGVWVAEIQELDGFSKVDSETVKSFLASQEDNFRPAYGRQTVHQKQQSVMIGTANKRDFLIDETGNRRFLPVDIGIQEPKSSVFTDLKPVIGQIWAEAVLRWRLGESIYPDAEMEKQAAMQQEDHMQEDPREGMVEEFLRIPIPPNWYSKDLEQRRIYIRDGHKTYQGGTVERRKVCAAEVWAECFGKSLGEMTKRDTREINAILARLLKEWKRELLRFWVCYGVQRGFCENVTP